MKIFNFLKLNKNQDLRKPECPYCNSLLEKIPGKKTKCVNCGNFMLIRTTPKGNNRVVVTEDKAREIDLEWAKINGTYDYIIKEENELNKIRKEKREKYGKEPYENDVKWSRLNAQSLDHIKNDNWGLYTSVKREMAKILKKEEKLLGALAEYLTMCFLEVNGANNSPEVDSKFLKTLSPNELKDFLPFNPDYYNGLNPWLIGEIKKIIAEKNLTVNEVKDIFIKRAMIINKYGAPLSPEECWIKIEKEFF
jgi:hypothetical protein